MFLILSTLALLSGFALDLLLGDPQGWPHIIRAVGALIAWLEKRLYPLQNKRLGGTIFVIFTLPICTIVPAAMLFGAYKLSVWVYFGLETLLVWQLLAASKASASRAGMCMMRSLQATCSPARKAVSMIAGKDTDALNAQGLRAAVETVAENASTA
ncbi:MAG: cobalamin biosynthesis protein [Eubacteriales bacterium]